MKLLCGTLLLVPLLAIGQNAVQTQELPYRDGLFSLGAAEGAPPVDFRLKLKIYSKRIVAPRVFLGVAVTAAVKQAENSPGKYGRTLEGYGKRYGTDYARIGIRNVLAFGIDSALHLDPRFFRAPDGMTNGSRLQHAIRQVLIVHKDNGGSSFAFGSVISAFAAGEAGSLWLPRRSDGKFGDGLLFAGLLIAGDAGRNVVREFWPDIRRKIRHK